MTERYKDFYGCTASIQTTDEGCRLRVKDARGRSIANKVYGTHRGAVRAMNNNTEAKCELIK